MHVVVVVVIIKIRLLVLNSCAMFLPLLLFFVNLALPLPEREPLPVHDHDHDRVHDHDPVVIPDTCKALHEVCYSLAADECCPGLECERTGCWAFTCQPSADNKKDNHGRGPALGERRNNKL